MPILVISQYEEDIGFLRPSYAQAGEDPEGQPHIGSHLMNEEENAHKLTLCWNGLDGDLPTVHTANVSTVPCIHLGCCETTHRTISEGAQARH